MDYLENIINLVINDYTSKKIKFIYELLPEDFPKTHYDADLVIILHAHANNHTEQQLAIAEKSIDNDFVILTGNYRYYQTTHKNVVYFPYYYFDFLNDRNRKTYNLLMTRPYKLQCLNLNPWYHRTINYLEMKKKPWFNECKFSFNWAFRNLHTDTFPIARNTLSRLKDHEFEEILHNLTYQKIPIKLDDWEQCYTGNSSFVHGSCYIDYVTENSVTQEFITEKSWKPIFSGQLFLILGSVNIISYFRSIGIDVFDDIIDHSYDTEIDVRVKVEKILTQLDILMQSDIEQIWGQTYLRRKKNLDLVLSKEFSKYISQDIIKKVS